MSPEIMGLAGGATLGIMAFFSMRYVADTMERNAENREEGLRKASMVRMIGAAELILFTVLGYAVGPQLFLAD